MGITENWLPVREGHKNTSDPQGGLSKFLLWHNRNPPRFPWLAEINLIIIVDQENTGIANMYLYIWTTETNAALSTDAVLAFILLRIDVFVVAYSVYVWH